MVTQWLYWTICLMTRALAAFCKSPVPSESKLSADMLINLLEIQATGQIFKQPPLHSRQAEFLTKCKTGSEEDVELGAPLKLA